MSLARGLTELLPNVTIADAIGGSEAVRIGAGVEPALVVAPTSTEELAQVVRWAGREGVGVLPLASGARATLLKPEGRFVVLDTRALTGIEEYEPADLTVTSGAGTRFAVIDDRLRANGQWAPFDAPAMRERTIGGLVADAPHGPLWAGYGALKNHVLGATVVTGDGRVLRLGGKVVKNVAGFDLLRTVVGSRGRLGVVTSVCLRAFPLPVVDRVLVRIGGSVPELLEAALAVGTAPVLPVSVVIASSVRALDDRAALVVRLHGAGPTVDADQRSIEAHLGGALESVAGPDALLDEVASRTADKPRSVEVSVLPTRLAEVLSVLDEVSGLSVVVDSYGGHIRVAGPTLTADVVDALRTAAERAHGALRLVAWDSGADRPKGSEPSDAEAMLSRRLETIFDPGSVLWPARA